MNQINDRPLDYDFGLEFNYALWTPNTELSLVNVPWNSDYRDIVRFDDRRALNRYIDSRQPTGIIVNQVSYVKFGEPIRLDIPINRAMKYNYLRASNSLQPVPGNDEKRDYYYFILDVRYVAPNTTELVLQLDVVQTFIYDVEFGRCYVERGHIGIANENQFSNYGRDYLTVPEGLDIGADYRIIAKRVEEIMTTIELEGMECDVLVVSTVDLLQDPGTEEDPNLENAEPSTINGLPSGAGFYLFEGPFSFRAFMRNMKKYPWITQGIISVTAVPKVNRYLPPSQRITYPPIGIPMEMTDFHAYPVKHRPFNGWRDRWEILKYIPEKYRHLRKLFTYPYMVIEMTTWSGTPVVLRPEAWNDPNAEFLERMTYMPPNQRVQFLPRRYNSSGQEVENMFGWTDEQLEEFTGGNQEFIDWLSDLGDDYGDYLDIITQVANFPALPIVNNMAISFMASNAHSIAYQRRSADWSQQRAMQGAAVQYGQANRAIDTAYEQYQIGVTADASQVANQNRTQAAQAVVSGIGGMVGNAASGAMGGAAFGPAGAAAGAAAGAVNGAISGITNGINTGIGIAANDESLAIRNLAASRNITAQTGQMSYVADTNNAYAKFAARGDYANAIAGINAKVQDAEMIQPSVSGQFGGDAANISHGTMEMSLRWKLIDEAAIRRVGDFWLRYGYAIQAFVQPPANLHVMTRFTYWKLLETYISSATIPESFKQTIRGVLEKGVTVWRNPDDMGKVDLGDNKPLAGIRY